MENAADIGGKVGENLRTSLEQLPLSKKLTTIKCDVKLKESLFELKSQNPDTTKLLQIFTKLGFKSWLEESPESGNQIQESSPKPVVEAKYETILDEKLLVQWVKKLTNSKTYSFDTETTSLDYMEAELVGISFGLSLIHI